MEIAQDLASTFLRVDPVACALACDARDHVALLRVRSAGSEAPSLGGGSRLGYIGVGRSSSLGGGSGRQSASLSGSCGHRNGRGCGRVSESEIVEYEGYYCHDLSFSELTQTQRS